MPAPEPQRPDLPATDGSVRRQGGRAPDLSVIPTFLREGSRRTAAAADPPLRPRATLPRPVTPPAPSRSTAARDLDPAALPLPSLSRRRLVTVAGVLLAGWLTITFIRQVGEATAATNRATELRAANAALQADVERLERDLRQVQDMRYIRLEGRSFGLGGPGEIPFALEAGAPSLPADAPGSAAVRLGAEPRPASPLDAWLEVLFGSGR